MRALRRNWLVLLTHIGSWLPLAWLLWDWWMGGLSVNPIQDATLRTGKAALVLLVLSLACTPLNALLGFRQAVPLRKWFGLYAFFYASLHFLIFVGLDYDFDLALLKEAILEKRYALVGMAALLLLLPLAVTSTRGWMRRLGKRWKQVHRLVYFAALLAVVHYLWLVKSDIRPPLIFGTIVVILLVLRIPWVGQAVKRLRLRLVGAASQITALFK